VPANDERCVKLKGVAFWSTIGEAL
jgi:hypothetical protein